jgi:hypothetical protein
MESITALQPCTDQVATANLSESTRHFVPGSDFPKLAHLQFFMYLLKTLVFFLDSREGPKLTVNFKVGWQEADRVREGRLAISRQTGREKADRQKDANRGQ